jgi:hypothetical protein
MRNPPPPGSGDGALFASACAELDELREHEAEKVEAPSVELVDMLDHLDANALGSASNARWAPGVDQSK